MPRKHVDVWAVWATTAIPIQATDYLGSTNQRSQPEHHLMKAPPIKSGRWRVACELSSRAWAGGRALTSQRQSFLIYANNKIQSFQQKATGMTVGIEAYPHPLSLSHASSTLLHDSALQNWHVRCGHAQNTWLVGWSSLAKQAASLQAVHAGT